MQAYPEKLALQAEESFACKRFSLKQFLFRWHYHPEFELTLMTKGSGKRFVGDHVASYKPGDLVLLGPMLPHTWLSEAPGPVHCSLLQFPPDVFRSRLGALPELKEVSRLLERSARGLLFDAKTARQAERLFKVMDSEKGVPRLILVLRMLSLLASSPSTPLTSPGFTPAVNNTRDLERIDKVIAPLYERPAERIPLRKAASLASMSVPAFGRFFKRCTGKTWIAYVTEFRIGIACRLLIESNRSISEICFESGFNNLSNFNRKFLQQKGMNPMAFRKEFSRN